MSTVSNHGIGMNVVINVFCLYGLCFVLVFTYSFIYVRCVTMVQPKKGLVCLGENRREVMFSGNAKDLLGGVVEVFSDILSAQKISTSQLVLQLKNKD